MLISKYSAVSGSESTLSVFIAGECLAGSQGAAGFTLLLSFHNCKSKQGAGRPHPYPAPPGGGCDVKTDLEPEGEMSPEGPAFRRLGLQHPSESQPSVSLPIKQ